MEVHDDVQIPNIEQHTGAIKRKLFDDIGFKIVIFDLGKRLYLPEKSRICKIQEKLVKFVEA